MKNTFFIGMCAFSWQSLVRIQQTTLLEEHSNMLLVWVQAWSPLHVKSYRRCSGEDVPAAGFSSFHMLL